MKKFTLMLSAMLFSVMSFAAEAKFDWSGITTTQSPTVANVYTQGDVTLTFEKASGSNIPAENKEGSIRMYKGTTLKIVVAGENNVITNVAFTCTGTSYAATNLQYNGEALPSNEWALTTPAAEILLNAVANARFKSIVDRFGDDPDAMKQAGISYATEQIIDLINSAQGELKTAIILGAYLGLRRSEICISNSVSM